MPDTVDIWTPIDRFKRFRELSRRTISMGSWCALFFAQKVDALKIHAKTTKLTATTVQICPISLHLALSGGARCPGGCTYNFPL